MKNENIIHIVTFYATEKEILKAYWMPKYIKILGYKFLGIHTHNDIDINQCTPEQKRNLATQPCLYAMAFKTITPVDLQVRPHYTTLYNLKRAVKRQLNKKEL